jgi:cell wall-associated NlpC family hydrolase
MHHSKRILRTALTGSVLGACLILNASALTYGVGTVTGDSLRLRAGADTSTTILATASKGTTVAVLENQSGGWYKVNWKGTVGYMSADYLSVSVTAEANLGTATLNTDGAPLNLRAGPGTGYDKVTTIPTDATLTITGISDGWYHTSYNGVTGYVLSDYVTLGGSASSTTSTGVVNTGGASLNLRSGPGTSYSKVATIPASATLTITGSENGWYKTSYNGVTGYVLSSYVTLGGSASASASSTSSTGTQIVAYAKQFLGCSYVYGASGPSSFDCSGFTSYVFKHFGYTLNRSAASQYSNGTAIDKSQLQPGDLLLWRAYGSSSTATHAGIYIGNNQYIHASSTAGKVVINDMDYANSTRYLVGVRRIAN